VEALGDLLDLAADLVVASQEVDIVIRRDPSGQRHQRVARAIRGHLASSAVPAFDVRAGVAEKSDRAQVQEHRLARGSDALDGGRGDLLELDAVLTVDGDVLDARSLGGGGNPTERRTYRDP
jgi:hypothetical protein